MARLSFQRAVTVLAAVAAFAGLQVLPAHGATFTLPTCGPNVFDTLGLIDAIERANDETHNPGPDTIELRPGCLYEITQPYEDTTWGLPKITSAITINGHGATIQRRDPNSATGDPGAGSIGLVDVLSSGDLILNNVTLANGAGPNGGILANSGTLLMVDSTITDSTYGNNSTAFINFGGSATLLRTRMYNNRLDDGGAGGAVRNQADLYLIDSTFDHNSVLKITGGIGAAAGGAISNSGRLEMWGTTFDHNHTAVTAGAISNGGELYIHDSTFTGNSANFGGAISNSSDLVVDGSYFGANTAFGAGAIRNDSSGLAQIRTSTFYGNRATADEGGAITNGHSLNAKNSTFAQNTAHDPGAAIYTETSNAVTVVESDIFAGTTGTHCGGAVPLDFGNNLAYPDSTGCASSFTVADPVLAATPAVHGGSTPTLDLGTGSAAIDQIASGCPSTDQRGLPRPAAGGTCDIGAVEDQPPTTPGSPTLASGDAVNNTGQFSIDWTGSTDVDGDLVQYHVYSEDYDDSGFALEGTVTGSGPYAFGSGSPEGEGTWRYRVAAFDGNHESAQSGDSAAVVVDMTDPTTPNADADRLPDVTVGTTGWYLDTVTVSFTGATDPALADTSKGSGIDSVTSAVTFATSGAHTATGSATDEAGNTSPTASLTVHVDATAPVTSFSACPATVLLHSVVSLGWTASDADSGLVTPATGSIPVDTATVGTRTYTTTATDAVGHSTTATCVTKVIYDFSGFADPILNLPSVNSASAGKIVPLSFGLAGNQGLAILAAGYPVSAPMTCGSTALLTSGTPTASAPPGLSYTGGKTNRYTYFWKTPTSWKNTCRQFVLLLDDGTYHRLNFRFK